MGTIKYSKKEKGFIIDFDIDEDARFMNDTLLHWSIQASLESQGFDLSTLKFSIKKKSKGA